VPLNPVNGQTVSGVDASGHPHTILTDSEGRPQFVASADPPSPPAPTIYPFNGQTISGVDSGGHPHTLLVDGVGKLITTGSSGGSGTLTVVAFSYATPSPMVLQAVTAGQIISRALIQVQTAFDGAGATLTLGTTATPDLILKAIDVFPGVVDQYAFNGLTEIPSDDFLILTITPAGSTMGTGQLLFELPE
jgi:hypothetical protein